MPIPVPKDLLAFLHEGTRFIVAGHKEPDGDCVGSQLALSSMLNRMGKEAIPCSAGPFKRPEIIPYSNLFRATLTEEERRGAKVIVLDCSMSERVGELESIIAHLPTAVIDHHASSSTYGDVRFLDEKAPSVTFMVLAIIEALGLAPTKEEAELLFFGLCTDTGFFRHLGSGSEVTFEYASRLVQAGANPKKTFQAMNGGKSLDSRRLMGIILERTEAYFDGKLLLSFETQEETNRYGLQGRDSDAVYQLLQSIQGVEAVVLIRQETEDNCTVGLRSRAEVNVANIAAQFGGGGHVQAAGLSTKGTIAELKEKLLEAFSRSFLKN